MNQNIKKIDWEDIQSNFSIDPKLGKLLKTLVNDVNHYASVQKKHIKRLSEIGIALSTEKDINKLFEMIVEEARNFFNAEAGTLYIVDKEDQSLKFEAMQNEVMNTGVDKLNSTLTQLPNVPLYLNDVPNHSNVSSYTALTGNVVNIPDIYDMDGGKKYQELDFSGTRKYDRETGYHTESMLVIPMINHENDTIGVLQLINARDKKNGEVIPFSARYVDIISSLASQAAVALTNVHLIQELKDLFYAFIRTIATAIDEKSSYTGGHITRVAELTMMIAKEINACDKIPFKNTCLDENQLAELHMAAWMHDVGKITTPEYVVDKSTKLETIFDRIHLIELRFSFIEELMRNDYLNKKIVLMETDQQDKLKFIELEQNFLNRIADLQSNFDFIKSCNNSGDYLSDEKVERLREIGHKTYFVKDEKKSILSENEIDNLCIRKGTLTAKEREIIENHAKMTFDMISQLPFPKNLSKVPEYAAAHHEKLDCSGYPNGLCGEKLSLQSRILAIADIFEALTAKDRPYKEPMSLSQALSILNFMKNDNHIDPDILNLFINTKLYLQYAKKEMNPEQVDIEQ